MQSGGDTVESRIEALERKLASLTANVDVRLSDHKQRLHDRQGQLDAVSAGLNQHIEQEEREQRAALRESVAYQAWGTLLLVLGLAFTFAGTAWTC